MDEIATPDGARPEPASGRPLPPPPEPWRPADMPEVRSGPPFVMTEMIEAEPALAVRLLDRLREPGGAAARLATAIREALATGATVTLTGCGTSEHAAIGAAAIVGGAVAPDGTAPNRVVARQALDAALDAWPGLLVAITHEGGSRATVRAIEAATRAGTRTALITAAARSPAATAATASGDDLVLATDELDQSWCHTVAYVAPLVAAAAVAGHLGQPLDASAARRALSTGLAAAGSAEAIAAALAGIEELVVLASGVDVAAGRELALKVEEAAALPSAYRDLETFLHGHLAATDDRTGLVLLLADPLGGAERARRAAQALDAAAIVGIRAAAILTEPAAAAIDAALTPAGRVVVAEPDAPRAIAALLATATPLQLLAERLARARGRNPDPIRRDETRYSEAAAAASGDD